MRAQEKRYTSDDNNNDMSRAQWCVPVKLRLVGKIFERLENVIALGQPVA